MSNCSVFFVNNRFMAMSRRTLFSIFNLYWSLGELSFQLFLSHHINIVDGFYGFMEEGFWGFRVAFNPSIPLTLKPSILSTDWKDNDV